MKPYTNALTAHQLAYNHAMSSMRVAVEWGFGKVIKYNAFLDFKKNPKILLQEISGMYNAAVFLSNCHTCLYGSQTGTYFDVDPPTLEEYLNV